ncbi:pre-mRNA-splicing factor SPP2 [Seiridium cupressi]
MSESTSIPQAPRIAIKFGASLVNAQKPTQGAKKPGKPLPPSALGKRSRPHALNHDSDSDEEDDYGKHESVTTIGERGAENAVRPRDAKAARTDGKPLVIACQTEGGWKAAAAKAQKGGRSLPHEREENFNAQVKETEPADHEKQIKWGLSVTTKSDTKDSPGVPPEDVNSKSAAETVVEENTPTAPKTVEQDAMDALLGNNTKKKTLVISESDTPQDEYKAAYQAAGEVSTIEEYDKIPDGEFGMAMLRGMGYKESQQSTKPKEVRRRPALLGLGAKEDEEIKKAELAKKHGHRERPPRLDEFRRGEEAKRKQREERHSNSYKHERERERSGYSSSRRHDDRDRDRDRYRNRDRHSRH